MTHYTDYSKASASHLGSAAKSGGTAGAAVGAGLEAFSSISDWLDGEKSIGEVAADVAVADVKGGVTGGVSGAIGTAAKAAVAATASIAVPPRHRRLPRFPLR